MAKPKKIETSNRFDAFLDDNDEDEPENFIHPDTGASKTCVTADTVLRNETPTPNGLKVGSCSNHILESKAKRELKIKGLPKTVTTAYKFDDMSLNLLSMGQVCDAGCVGVFKEKEMIISKETDIKIKLKKDPVLTGKRKGNNDLWKIPLPKAEKEIQKANAVITKCHDLALSAYNQKAATDLAKYLHACAGYPVIDTWIKAIKKEYYSSWPKLDQFRGPKWIKKHLPKSVATTMGHMKAQR